MKFKLYYGDGTTYEGETSEDAFNAPVTNIQIAKQEASNERGFSLRHGCNFFCWEGTRWGGKSDIFGLMDYYSFHKGPQKVIVGREIYDGTYQEICRQAVKDGCLCTIDNVIDNDCNHVEEQSAWAKK